MGVIQTLTLYTLLIFKNRTMPISNQQRKMLLAAWDFCDKEEKSTEYMFQYMADTANADYDEVVDFVVSTTPEKREAWHLNESNN